MVKSDVLKVKGSLYRFSKSYGLTRVDVNISKGRRRQFRYFVVCIIYPSAFYIVSDIEVLVILFPYSRTREAVHYGIFKIGVFYNVGYGNHG